MRIIFTLFGIAFAVIGTIGIPLPILPTTPFYLLASCCFMKGNSRLDGWFKQTKFYTQYILDFSENRSMTLKRKLCILIPVTAMLFISILLVNNLHIRLFLAGILLIKYYYFIFRIQTIHS